VTGPRFAFDERAELIPQLRPERINALPCSASWRTRVEAEPLGIIPWRLYSTSRVNDCGAE
jgi:hypothetical protein